MPILTGTDAHERLAALKEANEQAYDARRAFLRAKVRDGEVYAAVQALCHALDRLVDEAEVVE